MAKPRIIHKWEKNTVISIAVIVDIVQIILNFFAVGVVINRIIDIVMAILIAGYGVIRRLWTVSKALTFVAYFVGEMIPIVDVLPFWTLDIINLYGNTVSSKEERDEILSEKDGSSSNMPLNQNGVRSPQKPPPLLNSQGGIRPPNGGLRPPILGK